MNLLLKLSRLIDALNERVGRSMIWLILLSVIISAGNAVVRKAFNYSSNWLLEIQWYMFAAVFLLCAGYALKHNAHVRIDVVAGRFSHRAQAWIDILGTLVFLMPMAVMTLWLSWPFFTLAFTSGEMSSNPGGLIRWPVKLFVPLGFALLILQGVSELIKRIAFLQGKADDPYAKDEGPSAEEQLAAHIKATQGGDA